ncbi:hypothetical protein J1N35_038430 [Gossypium stocksii]|uniref:Uncharacterized protein n=1 Tax=Gossypium stocksii TaxID=47602 RepID=A0A9D3ULY9_9ROSI|nr:hypothetical protein J1N35_038430 [Gossypium stocksii]
MTALTPYTKDKEFHSPRLAPNTKIAINNTTETTYNPQILRGLTKHNPSRGHIIKRKNCQQFQRNKKKGLVGLYRPYGRPTVDRSDPYDPRENSKFWAHMLVWPTRPGLIPTCLCSPHGHTHITTQPYLAHGPAFAGHTVVSSHRANHMCDYTPVWHQQNSFSAFAEVQFSAF